MKININIADEGKKHSIYYYLLDEWSSSWNILGKYNKNVRDKFSIIQGFYISYMH